MEISKENNELLKRKHFLLRTIEHGSVDKITAENEIAQLDKEVAANTLAFLKEEAEDLKVQMHNARQQIKTDGPLKRQIGTILIKFLDKQGFTNDEVKGIMRQSYKICRYR